MKKCDILVLSCLLVASETVLADVANKCPTPVELKAFETAVIKAIETSNPKQQDRRMQFGYNGVTYYMPVEDQKTFSEEGKDKKTKTRLTEINFVNFESAGDRGRCFYTQTRVSPYNMEYKIPFRMTYFTKAPK